MESYEDVKRMLCDLPMTWYPALIGAMVEASYKKGVWRPGGASAFVKTMEDKILKRKEVKNAENH